MGVVLATTAGLLIWLVLWSLDVKAIDGFMIVLTFAVIAAAARMLTGYLPGKRA